MSEENEECLEHAGNCGDGFRPTKPWCPDCLRSKLAAAESRIAEEVANVNRMIEKLNTAERMTEELRKGLAIQIDGRKDEQEHRYKWEKRAEQAEEKLRSAELEKKIKNEP